MNCCWRIVHKFIPALTFVACYNGAHVLKTLSDIDSRPAPHLHFHHQKPGRLSRITLPHRSVLLLSFCRGSSQQHCLWYGRHGAVWKFVDGACHPHVTTCALLRGLERVKWRDGERDVSPAHVSGSHFSVRQTFLGASFFFVLGFIGEQQGYTVSSCYYVIACMVASQTNCAILDLSASLWTKLNKRNHAHLEPDDKMPKMCCTVWRNCFMPISCKQHKKA